MENHINIIRQMQIDKPAIAVVSKQNGGVNKQFKNQKKRKYITLTD